MNRVAYIPIGWELLDGTSIDTNSKKLSDLLFNYGLGLSLKVTVGDQADLIKRALGFSLNSDVELVVISGGLGSTDDDLTRRAISKFLGVDLEFNEDCWHEISEKVKSRGLPLLEKLKLQAMIPAKCELLPNPVGTACGFFCKKEGKIVAVLPGVPAEFEKMAEILMERLYGGKRKNLFLKILKVYGISEASLNELLLSVIKRFPVFTFAFLPDAPEIRLKIKGYDVSVAEWKSLAAEIERVAGKYIYSWENKPIAKVFGEELEKRGLFFAVAESCTGGLVAKTITDIPGSSHYFDRGFVTYSNEAKMDHLKVKRETLERYGAVSEETAREMVLGVLEHSNADIAASITGIAGPAGGTAEKPVGTVYTAIADREGRIEVVRNFFPGDREHVRRYTMYKVLLGVVKWLKRFYPL